MLNYLVDPDKESVPAEPIGGGFFEIQGALLAEILLFPKGTTILDIRRSPEIEGGFVFQIAGDSLPKVVPGERLTRVNPNYRRVFDSHPEFVSWGI